MEKNMLESLNFLEYKAEDLRELNKSNNNKYIGELQKKVQDIVSDPKLSKSLEGYGGIYIQSKRAGKSILIPTNVKQDKKKDYESAMEFLKPYHWVFNNSLLKKTHSYSISITPNTINSAFKIYKETATSILENPLQDEIKQLISAIPENGNVDELRQLLAGDLAGTGMAKIIRDELKNKEFHYLMLATFLYTFSISHDKDSGILIIGERDTGGVALRSKKDIEENRKFLVQFYRRFIRLIAMNEAIYKFEKGTYYERGLIENSFRNFLKNTCETFIEKLILTKDITENDLCVDENGIFSTKRIGNKRAKITENIVVIRLYVGSNKAFNFLYHNNAANFAKIENYMNGVLHGYQNNKEGNNKFKKIRIDVYIAPKIDDINAMEINPIIEKNKSGLKTNINIRSNFWVFYKNHEDLFNTGSGFNNFKFVLYLYSEIIGPSVFPAELVARIANQSLDCIFRRTPVKILDLFSGSGTLAFTVARQFEQMTEKVNVLSLDINPCVVNIKSDYRKSFHTVQADIFSFFDQVYEKETTFNNYDIVSADPHHFMVLDFLYKKVQLKRKEKIPFFKWLSSNTKVFILYFAHKEKESMGFFIHRVMSRNWHQVYSLLIGDEKIIIGTNFEDENIEMFENVLKQVANSIKKDYEMKSRGLKIFIFDSLLRTIALDK